MKTNELLCDKFLDEVDILLYGGCQVFALILHEKIGGEILYFNNEYGSIEHACVKKDNIIYDASGAVTKTEIQFKYRFVDMLKTEVVSRERVEHDISEAEVMDFIESNDVMLSDIIEIADILAEAIQEEKDSKPNRTISFMM